MKLRIGVIGLGRDWESCHAPALRALGDRFHVQAVCDPVAHRAQTIAQTLGARPVSGFHSLACQEDIDALLVLSGSWFGELPLFAACDSGKAVYCATPLEISPDRATALWRRAREAGIAFVAEFPYRHSPATIRLKELIATRLGPPRLLFCNERRPARLQTNERRSIGLVRLVHAVDWCRYIVGTEPTSVSSIAHGLPENEAASDYLSITLDFSEPQEPSTGPMAAIRWDRFIAPPWKEAESFRAPADLQAVCERGVAFIDLPDKLIWFDDAGQHTESLERDRPVGEQLLLHFYRAVTSLVLDSTGLDDAHRALEIVHLARKSYAERRWVTPDFEK